jgi:hypothetical protein
VHGVGLEEWLSSRGAPLRLSPHAAPKSRGAGMYVFVCVCVCVCVYNTYTHTCVCVYIYRVCLRSALDASISQNNE